MCKTLLVIKLREGFIIRIHFTSFGNCRHFNKFLSHCLQNDLFEMNKKENANVCLHKMYASYKMNASFSDKLDIKTK